MHVYVICVLSLSYTIHSSAAVSDVLQIEAFPLTLKILLSSLTSTVLQDMQRGVEECGRVCVWGGLRRGGCMLSSYPHCSGIELQQLEDCKPPDNAAIFRPPVLILLLSWWWRESHEF